MGAMTLAAVVRLASQAVQLRGAVIDALVLMFRRSSRPLLSSCPFLGTWPCESLHRILHRRSPVNIPAKRSHCNAKGVCVHWSCGVMYVVCDRPSGDSGTVRMQERIFYAPAKRDTRCADPRTSLHRWYDGDYFSVNHMARQGIDRSPGLGRD